jgi:hypothetical protein
MPNFKSRLARYNTYCCDQIMPVPVIPRCAIACSDPKPICEYKPPSCPSTQPVSQTTTCPPPIHIPQYNPLLPDPPTGTILTNTINTVPQGYLLCNGQAISRTTYSSLFTVIGTTYGSGDGSTTFNLPNLTNDTQNCTIFYIIKT